MLYRKQRSFVLGLGLAAVLGAPAVALAQPAPATSGKTEVATTGIQTVAKPGEEKDGMQLKLTAGGLLSQGNSRTVAATAAGDYRLRRNVSQFSALAAVNYGRSAPGQGEPYATTVENYQGKVRYDYFFAPGVAGFLSVSGRRDKFQGLDLRLNVDPGVAYYFIDEKAQQFWAELGYDLQHDIRQGDFIAAALLATPPEVLDKSETRHSVRAFLGYNNALTESVNFSSGVEYLQSVQESKDARLNVDASLAAKVHSNFSIATSVSVKYDNNPLPGVKKTDVVSGLSLVYSLAN